jgi:hypothetical protein
MSSIQLHGLDARCVRHRAAQPQPHMHINFPCIASNAIARWKAISLCSIFGRSTMEGQSGDRFAGEFAL